MPHDTKKFRDYCKLQFAEHAERIDAANEDARRAESGRGEALALVEDLGYEIDALDEEIGGLGASLVEAQLRGDGATVENLQASYRLLTDRREDARHEFEEARERLDKIGSDSLISSRKGTATRAAKREADELARELHRVVDEAHENAVGPSVARRREAAEMRRLDAVARQSSPTMPSGATDAPVVGGGESHR